MRCCKSSRPVCFKELYKIGGVSVGYISLILAKFADFSLAVSLSALVPQFVVAHQPQQASHRPPYQ